MMTHLERIVCTYLRPQFSFINGFIRSFSLSSVANAQSPHAHSPSNLKGKSTTAQRWLLRQFKDPYVYRSKLEHYRCRSAYKLIEIDDRYPIFFAGASVLDCGAAPGSWTQVAVKRCNALGNLSDKPIGRIVAIDKLLMTPVDGAMVLESHDFTQQETQTEVRRLFPAGVNVVLSDMAPSSTGLMECDHERIIDLSYEAFTFAVQNLLADGAFVTKIWSGKRQQQLLDDMKLAFRQAIIVKPPASREDSAEQFLLGRGFKLKIN